MKRSELKPGVSEAEYLSGLKTEPLRARMS